MRAWRISKERYALDRQGTGAKTTGGRWNSIGTAAIYVGMTAEICALEKLVHTGEDLPGDLVLVEFTLPDDPGLYEELLQPPDGWNDLPSSASAVLTGDRFLVEGKHLALVVPSAIVPEARNMVINPNHPAMAGVTMQVLRPFEFDHRLKKI